MTDVSVVLPTYNEAETIRGVVSSLRSELQQHAASHEIIVVDDDSPDDTAGRVRAVWSQSDNVRVIVREDETGLASAVVRGFQAAEGDALVVLDADGQHPPETTPSLVAALDRGADLAVASRHVGDSTNTADWSIGRYVTSFGGAMLAWAALPPARRHIQDPMSGYFAVDAKVVDVDQLQPHGYKIMLEVLARCPIRRIAEVPTEFRPRAGSESNLTPRTYMDFLTHTFRLGLVYRTTPTVQQLPHQEVDA